MVRLSEEARATRAADKALRAAAIQAERQIAADRREAEAARKASRTAASTAGWIKETSAERRTRITQEKADRGRAQARRRANPKAARLEQAAAVAGVPEIQRDPAILDVVAVPRLPGQATPIAETVRKLTRVEVLQRSGVLEAHEAAACEWYAGVHALAFDTIGCTANYEGRSGGGFGAMDLLARHAAQAHAREDYRMACEHVPAQYRGIFEAVVCRNETLASVAAAAFDAKRSQGESKVRSAVKLCANLLYGRIAPLLNVPELAVPARPSAPKAPEARPTAAAELLVPQLRAAIARAREGAIIPTHLFIAPMTLRALGREMGEDLAAAGAEFDGLAIEIREKWNWGLLLGEQAA
jgi:hypothetical protein